MNRIERHINQRLENCGFIKRVLKDAYQRTASLIPVPEILPSDDLVFHDGFFVGFHDICPWSPSGLKLLAHYPGSEVNRRSHTDGSPLRCKIGFFDSHSDFAFKPVGTTRAWNWQEGARLQWVNDDSLIWNDIRNGILVSVRKNLASNKMERLGPPIHSISNSGRLATSLSYMQIAKWSLAYSYLDLGRESSIQTDHLIVLDLETHETQSQVLMSEILERHPCDTKNSTHHFFSHTTFSPDENQCAFFHCWLHGKRRFSRLFIKNLDNGTLTLVSDSNWISHYCWDGNDALVVYDEDCNRKRGYRRMDLTSASFREVGPGVLTTDGHPQVSPKGRWLITDTYPDRFMQQTIIIHDLENDVKQVLVKVKVPFHFRYDNRCDFHPRWNRTGTAICFDSAHSRRRSLFILNVQTPT